MTGEHLDSDLVAGYAERRLDRSAAGRVEAHVADCADCRRDLAAVTGQVAGARRRHRLMVVTPGLVAASVALVVLSRGLGTGGPAPEQVMRPAAPGAERRVALPAYLPGPGARVDPADLEFVWGRDGPDALFDLTVADSAGEVVWRARTSDTVLTPPDSLRWVAGARYHWWVDVLLPDGRVATTGPREFVAQP